MPIAYQTWSMLVAQTEYYYYYYYYYHYDRLCCGSGVADGNGVSGNARYWRLFWGVSSVVHARAIPRCGCHRGLKTLIKR